VWLHDPLNFATVDFADPLLAVEDHLDDFRRIAFQFLVSDQSRHRVAPLAGVMTLGATQVVDFLAHGH